MHFRQDFCLRAKPAKPCYSSLSAMSRVSLTFLWETPARAIPVFSVFIPFFGCPRRCVFCSQHDQTGQQASPLDEILARSGRILVFYNRRLAADAPAAGLTVRDLGRHMTGRTAPGAP